MLVADPGQILAESPRGLSDLYVALTRATQRLGVVYSGELPPVLAGLKPVGTPAEIDCTARPGFGIMESSRRKRVSCRRGARTG